MKLRNIVIFTATLLFLLPGTVFSMQSAHFRISPTVMSCGGGIMTSASFSALTVLGQPTPLMDQDLAPASDSFILYPGYLYAFSTGTFCPWDLSDPLDGDVDGQDLYDFIDLYGSPGGYDATHLPDFSTEFGRDDCF